MKFFFVVLVSFLTGISVLAEERGVFIGASAAWTLLEEPYLDESNLNFKVFAGYEFNRFLAAEAGYHHLGVFGEPKLYPGEEPVLVKLESDAYTGCILLSFPPSERFILFTRLGISFHEDNLLFSNFSEYHNQQSTEWDLLGGVGTRFMINEQLSLRGEWERLQAGPADLDSLSLGVYYRF